MDKYQKSQIAKLTLLALLFFITPLLSTSMRPPYLYFLLNLLIVLLGAEAGLLSFLKPLDNEKKSDLVVSPKPIDITSNVIENIPNKVANVNTTKTETPSYKVVPAITKDIPALLTKDVFPVSTEKKVQKATSTEKKPKCVQKSVSEKVVPVTEVQKVNKCPSMPSLFFIGGGDAEPEVATVDEESEEEEEILTGQELYTKAETFIGNFYKQLKIQREDSWKKIHGFYNKAF